MTYANQDDYIAWLQGRAETVPLAEFGFWAARATTRINKNKVILDEAPDYLIECTCVIAEILFQDNQTRQNGELRSMSIGGYSESYVEQKIEPKELRKRIDDVIVEYLALTDLHDDFVFRGSL